MSIHTDQEHTEALDRITELMDTDPQPGTPDGDEMDTLIEAVVAYENIHYPI